MRVQISIHAPREGGDRTTNRTQDSQQSFQSTPPARGATAYPDATVTGQNQFQSTPPARGATVTLRHFGTMARFQSTPPARGATFHSTTKPIGANNFNPRPPRGGRLNRLAPITPGTSISIHAPREGGDGNGVFGYCIIRISIHAPREGGDLRFQADGPGLIIFQSTPPARGATASHLLCNSCCSYFNPRPPRGGRRSVCAPRYGCAYFNPRPPRGGRPHESQHRRNTHYHFNPRPPRGGRRAERVYKEPDGYFNPRPPRGGRQPVGVERGEVVNISIHAPREGGDTMSPHAFLCSQDISIHAPREGGDSQYMVCS